MVEQFRNFVNKNHLFDRQQKVLLAVSGGIDSVVMAHLFARLELQFAIAHCNFQLRGDASDGDERFVEALAGELRCPFFSTRFDTRAYATRRGISTQMAARDLRYGWFEQVRQSAGYDLVATAHHAGDDAETFFINLMRGTGLRGLQAIPLKQGTVVRPLKFATRALIGQWAFDEGLEWREDATNAETHYLRNKIRHQLLPLIEELSPGFAQRLNTTIGHLSNASEAIDSLVENQRDALLRTAPDGFCLDLEALKLLHPVGFWLFELLRPFGFTSPVVDNMAKAIDNPTGQQFASASHQAVLKQHQLLITSRAAAISRVESHVFTSPEQLMLPGGIVNGRLVERSQLPVEPPDGQQAWVDNQQLVFPLTLRRWRKGDRFVPFGMNGSKKVSDFFTDLKLSPWQKANVWILCDGLDRIVWVVGYRADNRFGMTSQTKQVWVLRIGE